MRRRTLLAVVAITIGCSSQAEQPAPAQRLAEPQRIASLSLGTDEILCALVSAERIVGLSRHSDNPIVSHVADIARRVGAKLDRDPEQIVALEPDLVLAARYSKIELRELVNQIGAAVVVSTAFVSFADIQDNIANIGRAVGEPERAAALIAEMDLRLADGRRPAGVSTQRLEATLLCAVRVDGRRPDDRERSDSSGRLPQCRRHGRHLWSPEDHARESTRNRP